MRLNRYIAESGYCSRREADRLIEAGLVTIDGRKGVLGDAVTEDMDVRVKGVSIAPKEKKVYLALNKPRGIVCTADPREPMNVIDYLGLPERVFPVGRLDKDSQGLLLLTNDGGIVNRVLRAAGGHEKEYRVVVDKPVTDEFLRKMQSGVPILDTVTLPCKAWRETQNSFSLILTQGLNRQIRRMCEYLGYRVTSLTRVRIMHIELGDMKPGHYRELTKEEIAALRTATSPAPARESAKK